MSGDDPQELRIASNTSVATKSSRLGHPSWQGIGAIVGIVALLVTVAIALPSCQHTENSSTSLPQKSSANNGSSNSGNNNDSCNITIQGQGSDIQANCATPAHNIASASYGAETWAFAGSPQHLPVPPTYNPDEKGYHCDRWHDWLRDTTGMYGVNLGAGIYLEAGQNGVVAVKSISIKLVDRRPVGQLTIIRCSYGGDGDVGQYAVVRTLNQETRIYARQDNGEAFVDKGPMPPSLIYVSESQASTLSILVDSTPGYIYEGYLVATIAKDGNESTLMIGTPEQPLRWLGQRVSSEFGGVDRPGAKEPEVYYGWNLVSHSWELNYSPFGS